jgi:tRNA(Ile)-lysidine synthase
MVDSRKLQSDLLNPFLVQWPDWLSADCTVEIGLSGGMDSMVLLDLLWRSRELRHFHLSAVHVHHGLSANADEWAAHCQRWCEARGVPLRVERVAVVLKGGDSLEAVAREARYTVYRQSAAQVIALAHHQDDQAETVLLQLLRGGGPHALAAMPVMRRLLDKQLWRPLLRWPRAVIEDYARSRELTWVDDESNADTRWRRNLLRHTVFPSIAPHVPQYRQQLERSAAQMWQAAQVLDEVAGADLQSCLQGGRLQLLPFRALSRPRQCLLLVYWLKSLGWGDAPPAAVEGFCGQVLEAAGDRHPLLQLSGGVLFRYRDQVWAEPVTSDLQPGIQPMMPGDSGLMLPRWGGRLELTACTKGISGRLLQSGFELRPRLGGERLLLAVGSKQVKTLLQEAGIPPRLRQRWPLLYLTDGRLAAVPSVAVAIDCQVGDGLWPQWLPGEGLPPGFEAKKTP